MTDLAAFLTAVASRLGKQFNDVWTEVRPIENSNVNDIWLEGSTGDPTIVVASNESDSDVRIQCNSFEFDNVPEPAAVELVVALIRGEFRMKLAGYLTQYVRMEVSIPGAVFSAKDVLGVLGRGEPTEWERLHLSRP